MEDIQIYQQVGGKRLIYDDGFGNRREVWNFGLLLPESLDKCQQDSIAASANSISQFKLSGTYRQNKDRYFLWRFCNILGGFVHYWQQTGSCVGHGGGHALEVIIAQNLLMGGDIGSYTQPFFLLPYGRSRFLAGMRGRGEGSTGSTFADAVRREGTPPVDAPGLPKYQSSANGNTYGSATEMQWSDGGSIDRRWLELAAPYKTLSTAKITSTQQAAEAIQNGFPLTIASSWGGHMRCQVQGNPGVLLNSRVTTWMHQMSVLGWWDHPSLGEIFLVQNSWPANAHGQPQQGEPPCSFWIRTGDMRSIISEGETFVFSDQQEFRADRLDMSLI